MKIGKFGRIGIGWAIITVTGVYSFVLSRRSVDQKRVDGMKVRERMRQANSGDYPVPERRFD